MKALFGDQLKEWAARNGKTVLARLDAEGTAKPLTRICNHVKAHWCVGPSTALHDPEYEAADGTRISLTP